MNSHLYTFKEDKGKKVLKWYIYIVPFPYGYAHRGFTMTGLPPGYIYKVVNVCWYSFY